MMNKSNFTREEQETKESIKIIAADGFIARKEPATVYVNDLDMFNTVKLLDHTPVVLSVGNLCEENGYSYECPSK